MSINKLTLKRINADFKKFNEAEKENMYIYPNPENVLEIYFLIIGHPGSPYENGHYIGKLVHNPEYPIKAPDYYMLTPSGRFDINKKICLTNSSYHQADWVAGAWNLVTMLEGLSSVFHSDIKEDKVGISHLTNTLEKDIIRMRDESIEYNNKNLSHIYNNFSIKK